jgi:sulfur carrier protein
MAYHGLMIVTLHHPPRTITVRGPKKIHQLLHELDILPETVLVVRHNDLLTEDETLQDGDSIEIRPVISGGGL